ncbi:MAG: hypothetical protein JW778_07075 [Candidatus Altiarchaeota archaeon]|nr:hypothetical protein [Candidatus Altiarchaeota archaeon]
MGLFEVYCGFVNRRLAWILFGLKLEWDPGLEKAIRFTKLKTKPLGVITCAWTTALTVIAFTVISSLTLYSLGRDPLPSLLAGFVLAVVLAYGISEYPKILANNMKIKSLGHAPEIVAYLIIPLKQNPNLEDAVKFAAEHGEGQMAEDLRKALWDVWSGAYRSVGEALPVLGYRWGEDIKGFEDAMYAIRTSQIEKSETRRLNTLDRAMDTVLKSVQKKFEEYINYLRIPTMVMFAGGALLPLVIIILLPLISFMGMDLGSHWNLFIILMAIVLGVFLFSEHTLSKRPAAFAPIRIPDNYPGLVSAGRIRFLGREGSAWKISFGLGAAISLLSVPYLLGASYPLTDMLNTIPIVIGTCFCLWLYMRGTSLPKKRVRDYLKRMEDETIEAAFHLGNRLLTGMSAEEAFIRVADMMSSKVGSTIPAVLENAIRNIRYLNMNLEGSLFDENRGALREISSGVVKSVFRVFTTTMKKSVVSASEALLVAANHIRQIRRVEDSLRDKISYTTSMIKATALLINPMICALAVYIANVFRETMENTRSIIGVGGTGFNAGMLTESTANPEMLQLITGLYMIALLIVLMRYVSVLECGDDPIAHRLQIAKGIPIALSAFIGVLLASSFL